MITIRRHKNKYKRTASQDAWDVWYELAKKYYEENGDLRVPGRYETENGMKLGRWIERQRAARKSKGNYYIDQEHIIRLNYIGMTWQVEKRASRDKWMWFLRKYKHEHGDILVPKKYCVDGYALGEWIAVQRQKYKKDELKDSEIKELENMGMAWSLGLRKPWSEWYAMAASYYKKYGNLRIPYSYLTADGKKLGVWINIQRDRYYNTQKRYKNGKGRKPLNQFEIASLEKIGMVWKVRKDRKYTQEM